MKVSPLSDKDKLTVACSTYRNSAEVIESFGMHASNGNYTTLRKYMEKYNLVISTIGKRRKERITKTYTDEECFSLNSNIGRSHVKKRILENRLIEYRCISCGLIGEWNGKPISLQLEHINGINDDNRLENLAFICPNCHSQTDTYAGKNKRNTLLV